MNATQFRIARPTNQLDAVVQFYTEGLGLKVIGGFKDHAGYDGVMLGLPDAGHHLEFTQFQIASEIPPPTKEHLLVFYFRTFDEYLGANIRLQGMHFHPVPPENPYWEDKSLTYEDPDKWRVVLFNGVFKG